MARTKSCGGGGGGRLKRKITQNTENEKSEDCRKRGSRKKKSKKLNRGEKDHGGKDVEEKKAKRSWTEEKNLNAKQGNTGGGKSSNLEYQRVDLGVHDEE